MRDLLICAGVVAAAFAVVMKEADMTDVLLLVGFFAVAYAVTRFVNKAGGLAGGC